MASKILVTGASGFLGHHVADALLAAGYGVRALNRSLDPRLEREGVEIARGSIDSSKAVLELGFSPRQPDDTLRDTIADLRQRFLDRQRQSMHRPDAGANPRAGD